MRMIHKKNIVRRDIMSIAVYMGLSQSFCCTGISRSVFDLKPVIRVIIFTARFSLFLNKDKLAITENHCKNKLKAPPPSNRIKIGKTTLGHYHIKSN